MSSARVDLPTSSAGLLPPPIRCRVRSRCDAGKGSDETGGAVETAECFVAFGGHLSQSFFFSFCLFIAYLYPCFCLRALTLTDLHNRWQGDLHMCVCVYTCSPLGFKEEFFALCLSLVRPPAVK